MDPEVAAPLVVPRTLTLLEYCIEVEKSSTMAMSRGRCTAVATAPTLIGPSPKICAKYVGWVVEMVTRVAVQLVPEPPLKSGLNCFAVES
jgi:hypothetical protein